MCGLTTASCFENGSTPSRAIENMTREAEFWIARQAEMTAIATMTSSALPSVSPTWAVTTDATPWLDSAGSSRSGAAISVASSSSPPPTPDVISAMRIAFGAVLRGDLVSSESSAALSNPYMTTAGPRSLCANSRTISRMTPMISMMTPAALMAAIRFTPRALMIVATTMSTVPSTIALVWPLLVSSAGSPPTSWNPLHTSGSTDCNAMAIAATLTM